MKQTKEHEEAQARFEATLSALAAFAAVENSEWVTYCVTLASARIAQAAALASAAAARDAALAKLRLQ